MRLLRLVCAWPAVWFVRFTARSRERVSTAAFARRAITRSAHEQDMRTVAELRERADQLLAAARGRSAS
jgi:hypothetical protein